MEERHTRWLEESLVSGRPQTYMGHRVVEGLSVLVKMKVLQALFDLLVTNS